MNHDDLELRDERLSRLLRTELTGEHAPPGWVRDALAVARPAPRVVPAVRRESWMRLLLPNLLGIALLVGLGLAAYLRPEVVTAVWSRFQTAVPSSDLPSMEGGIGLRQLWLALAVPAVILIIAEGWQGLGALRRWFR